jgi:hypothetical protein
VTILRAEIRISDFCEFSAVDIQGSSERLGRRGGKAGWGGTRCTRLFAIRQISFGAIDMTLKFMLFCGLSNKGA